MYCKKCGKSISDNLKYCGNCGDEVIKYNSNGVIASATEPDQKKAVKNLMYFIIPVVLIIGFISGYYLGTSRGQNNSNPKVQSTQTEVLPTSEKKETAAYAAIVNGEPIPRALVIEELEKQGGKEMLDRLITKTLVMQEAKKKNIKISEETIDLELAKITDSLIKEGKNFNEALKLQGMTEQQLRDQIMMHEVLKEIINEANLSVGELNTKELDLMEKLKNEADIKILINY